MAMTPGPLMRRGPRPLLLHLTLAMLKSTASVIASQNSSGDWPGWSTELGEKLRKTVGALPTGTLPMGALPTSVLMETLEQDRALIAGIAAYRRHPWQRDLPEPPVIWSEGESRILDYGGSGRAVLFVPSLVNRAHVLDLMTDRSMLRALAAGGVRVLLLDWGWPGAAERDFTLTDYIAGRLERALLAVPRGAFVVGYCMGGLLALAAALRRPDRVAGLALLATPWDFHAAGHERATTLAGLLPQLEPLMALTGRLPVDALQMLFALLDPWAIADKYRKFGASDPDTDRARMFVALEDWLNDGVPLAGPVARTCLSEWYGANSPARLAWRVAGQVVDPRALAMPTFVAIPARDQIVPPESAAPLAALIPGAVRHDAQAGHIGMVAGATAPRVLWQPLLAWLRDIPEPAT
jgi:polyhydroxyalkanoate synthase